MSRDSEGSKTLPPAPSGMQPPRGAGEARATGDSFAAEVVGLDDEGAGLVDLADPDEDLRIHVAGALPGEHISGRISYRSVHLRRPGEGKRGQREAWGSLVTVHRPSPDRVAPICPAYGQCGGCSLAHLAYPAQQRWKRLRVRDQLGRQGELAAVEVAACVASPLILGYRNQAKYVYGCREDGEPILGGYAAGSHRVVDLAGCRVVEPIIDQARATVLQVLRARGVAPFCETRRTGLCRYLILRASGSGQLLATLVAVRDEGAGMDAVAVELMARIPGLAGVVLNLNRAPGNVLFGQDERLLAGQGWIEDEIAAVRVRLASRSFFQANRAAASAVYRDLVAAVPSGLAAAVDAYSGAGGIAGSLLARVGEVTAIEQNPAATQAASANRSDRLRIVTGDVALGLAAVAAADLIVLNPPRKGCSPEVLGQVLRIRPVLVAYLSCHPQSLARDLVVLTRAGARVESVVPYDMMPHTHHVETLAILSWCR